MDGPARIWTEKEVDRIKALIADDLSASGIAKAIGETRNAIMGIVHRRHLKLHGNPKGGRAKGETMKQSKIPGVLAPDKTKAKSSVPIVPVPPVAPLPEARPPSREPAAMRRAPLIDLKHNECRWPVDYDPTVVGHHLFCGRPTRIEQSYCDHHGARAAPPLRGAFGG